MSSCLVTIAAYDLLDDVSSDWTRMEELAAGGRIRMIDAAMIEMDRDTVTTFRRWWRDGPGHGEVASAVVALLRPPAMVTGAAAGGVGERVLVSLSRGMSRRDVRHLGEVLDVAPHVIVAIQTTEGIKTRSNRSAPWHAARAMAHAETSFTDDEMFWAMLGDCED